MQVKLAKTAGFCFGVQRAVDMVYNEVNKGKKIYTYGPVIHNDIVINDLAQKGVTVINDINDLPDGADGSVIIRAHGVGEEIINAIQERGIELIDATCPFVKKIHRIVAKCNEECSECIIVGSKDHPEVLGIMGWCSVPVTVISSLEEAMNYKPSTDGKICIVSQTTFNLTKFQDIVDKLGELGYYKVTVNTICSATADRQSEAATLSKEVGAMIVIGDEKSSNSRKLFEICSENCENTVFIQTLDDLNLELPKFVPCVGITAGASTPKKIIEEVQNYVRINF